MKYTGVPKVALLDFKNITNPFPLESYVQHVDTSVCGQISTPESLINIINLNGCGNLTVLHLPRKMDVLIRSAVDRKCHVGTE